LHGHVIVGDDGFHFDAGFLAAISAAISKFRTSPV
jgi:hypothetical protein